MGFGSGGQAVPGEDEEEEQSPTATDHENPEPETEGDTQVQTPSSDMDGNTAQVEQGAAERLEDSDVTDYRSPEDLARALMVEEYHDEGAQIPYVMWRKGTSTGRSRTTVEYNHEVDDLLRSARREFEDRYGTSINKADLREMAMVVGLMDPDKVFAVAEEWAIHQDKQ